MGENIRSTWTRLDHVTEEPWFAVRCIVHFTDGARTEDGPLFEERITLWRAANFDEAVERAEVETRDYASVVGGRVVEFAQCFRLSGGEEIQDGTEVFSLMRNSGLPPDRYVDRFFDTGQERQGTIAQG